MDRERYFFNFARYFLATLGAGIFGGIIYADLEAQMHKKERQKLHDMFVFKIVEDENDSKIITDKKEEVEDEIQVVVDDKTEPGECDCN